MGTALGNFVTVRYEDGHPAADAVIKKFGVQGFPTLLVLGPDGEEWDEVWCSSPAKFVEDLARIRSGTETLPALRTRVAKDPADREAAHDLAWKLANRYAGESVALCRRLLTDAPDGDAERTPKLIFLQGYAESNRGSCEAALALFERLLDEFPKTESARRAALTATNFLSELPPEQSLAFVRRVLPLADEQARESLESTREYLYLVAAEAAWLRRGEEAEDEPELLNMYAWTSFLRNWHTEKATAWARKAVELSDRAPHILDTLANLLFRGGHIDEAIRLEVEALASATEAAERATYEEHVVQWRAVKALRERRAKEAASDD